MCIVVRNLIRLKKGQVTVEHLIIDRIGIVLANITEGKPVLEIVAICCMACNRNRGSNSLEVRSVLYG